MSLIHTFNEKMGRSPIKVDIDVQKYIFKDNHFSVKIKLHTKKRVEIEKAKLEFFVETQEGSLFWLAMGIVGGGHGSPTKTVKYSLQKEEILQPMVVEPNGTFEFKRDFFVDPRLYINDGYHIKATIKMKDMMDYKKKIYLKILNDIHTDSAFVTLVEKMGFKEMRPSDLEDPLPLETHRVKAPKDKYPHLSYMYVTFYDLKDGRLDLVLAIELYESPEKVVKGKHETIMRRITVRKEDMVTNNKTINYHLWEEKIENEIKNAITNFNL